MKELKNPKTLVVLILAAAGVWGVILCRLFAGAGTVPPREAAAGAETAAAQPDSLLLDYRDPFLEVRRSAPPAVPVVRRSLFSPPEQKELPPPAFRMRGKIRKGTKDFLLAGVQAGNRLVGLNEKVDGFTILKIYDDSVVVCRGGKRYTLVLE